MPKKTVTINMDDETPKVIRIGYINYKTIPLSHEEASQRDTNGVLGQIHTSKHIIEYDESLNEVEKANTILHEALHGINDMYGIKFPTSDAEEDTVRPFANAMTALIKDNPEFFEWMIQILKK